jgi:hypothetical protein
MADDDDGPGTDTPIPGPSAAPLPARIQALVGGLVVGGMYQPGSSARVKSN